MHTLAPFKKPGGTARFTVAVLTVIGRISEEHTAVVAKTWVRKKGSWVRFRSPKPLERGFVKMADPKVTTGFNQNELQSYLIF